MLFGNFVVFEAMVLVYISVMGPAFFMGETALDPRRFLGPVVDLFCIVDGGSTAHGYITLFVQGNTVRNTTKTR